MQNYFNYFTEIEEHFQRRRGSLLLLSTLDWALIETWRDAGVPLAAVLRGIDTAFDKHDGRRHRSRRVNGLAWCAQAVMTAVEEMQEAAVGAGRTPAREQADSGFEQARIAAHLSGCAAQIRASVDDSRPAATALSEIAVRLDELAAEVRLTSPDLEALERNLTVLEEKVFAVLIASAPESDMVALREQAARELAPYRSRMQALQIRQVEQQFLHKKILEQYGLPRLSLFYMSQS